MSRPVIVLVLAVALVVAGVCLLVALPQATQYYSLPTRTGGVTRHRAWFVPGVVATVVAAVVVLLTAAGLVVAALGRATKRIVLAGIGVAVVDVIVLAVVSGLSRPVF